MSKLSFFISIIIVYLIIIICKQVHNKYEYVNLPENIKNMNIEESKYVPKVIYMTNKNKDIPSSVFSRWKELNPDYNIVFHDDEEGYNYIRDNFSQDMANFFKEIKYGPIKADLWRLCILYKEGGVYADIDIVPYMSISNFIPSDITFSSMISSYNDGKMTQAFIYTTRGNPIIKKCIEKMYEKRKKYRRWWGIKYIGDYWSMSGTYDLYDTLAYFLKTRFIKPGIHKFGNQKILLFKEKCIKTLSLNLLNPGIHQSDCHMSNSKGRILDLRSDKYDKDLHQFK